MGWEEHLGVAGQGGGKPLLPLLAAGDRKYYLLEWLLQGHPYLRPVQGQVVGGGRGGVEAPAGGQHRGVVVL